MAPMNPQMQTNAAPRFRPGHLVLLASVVLLSLGVIGVTGYFRLSSEAAALRSSLMKSVPGTWNCLAVEPDEISPWDLEQENRGPCRRTHDGCVAPRSALRQSAPGATRRH